MEGYGCAPHWSIAGLDVRFVFADGIHGPSYGPISIYAFGYLGLFCVFGADLCDNLDSDEKSCDYRNPNEDSSHQTRQGSHNENIFAEEPTSRKVLGPRIV